jgi:hypothetical protein
MYTYRVSVTLPDGSVARTFVYDVASKVNAKRVFFKTSLPMLRKNGLRGSAVTLRKSLPLVVERVGKTTLLPR